MWLPLAIGATALLPVATVTALLCAWRPSWWRVWVFPPIAGLGASLAGFVVAFEVITARTPWSGESIGEYWSAAFWGMGIGAATGIATIGVLARRQRRSEIQTSVR